jgi:flagellar basal body rod protein FlgC
LQTSSKTSANRIDVTPAIQRRRPGLRRLPRINPAEDMVDLMNIRQYQSNIAAMSAVKDMFSARWI